MKNNVYLMVTDRITEQLQKGIIPWRKPWVGTQATAINYVTRKPYSPLNQMLLGEPCEYLSFKQVQALGGTIKKGAKARMVVFYRLMQYDKPTTAEAAETAETTATTATDTKRVTIPLLRYYNVFRLADCEGIPTKLATNQGGTDNEPIATAEAVISDYVGREGIRFINDKPSDKAYYRPSTDEVVVPILKQYTLAEEYYSTTFHELTHSTMKKNRCDRESDNRLASFGSEEYSREELVAEIGSAMLCNRVGIDCDKAFRNSVAYIQSWLKALQDDNKMIVWAASRAEKSSRYILNDNDNDND